MTRFTEGDNERLERERFFKGHGRGTIAPTSAVQIGFKRLSPDATIPTKAHPADSGFDLVASADVIIEPGETVIVPTGIAVQLPPGYEATVRPRSGVTSKTKLRVQLGTIDNGYAGEIGVIVDNISNDTWSNASRRIDNTYDDSTRGKSKGYIVRKGDKLAQLVFTRLPDVEAVEVFDVGESARGASGFGSSGV